MLVAEGLVRVAADKDGCGYSPPPLSLLLLTLASAKKRRYQEEKDKCLTADYRNIAAAAVRGNINFYYLHVQFNLFSSCPF